MRPRKRLFIGLQLASLLFLLLGLGLFLYLTFFGGSLNLYLILLSGGLAVGVLVFYALGILGLVLAIQRQVPVRALELPTGLAIELFLPLTILLGRLLRVNKRRIEQSFIEVTNQLNRARAVRVDSEELVILVPHCLQYSGCPYKITMNIDNCRRCGRCKIDRLLEYRDRYGIDIYIVTGGTLARKVLREKRPRAVVAIACERDLVSGLTDIFPLPALGIINIRPRGPCMDTDVDLGEVEEAVASFTGGS